MTFRPVEDAFQEAIANGSFPGAVVLAGMGEEVVFERAFGFRSLVPEKSLMQPDTIFDLASLTKPLATATAIMLLVREKRIRLDDRVTRFFPNFAVFGKTHVTFRHLLAHCSGLPGWKPYYEQIIREEKGGKINFLASRAAKSYVFQEIHREKPLGPAGTQSLYSDLGFMFLGQVVEEITGLTLDRYCQDRIFKTAGLHSTSFVDLTHLRTRRLQPVQEMIAPTENCPWRKRILCGEVHDDNAYAMGGVAGHAGLFSSARDIHQLLTRLSRCLRGGDPFLPVSLVQEFLTRDDTVQESTYALGWDTPASKNSSSGSHFPPHSVGHLGFTGTSIWWDLEKDCHIILLTNRIHPSRSNDKIREFRPHIHDLIMKALLQ
ncbi:MAG: beta-lactamase family protein [Deltaproteobacteria bacterium]|nr:MAG: beta-lactamase family protein [Deltaproteobacteria bacterium]